MLHFFGVRGSTPAPGAEFARYGGHTSCVGISHDDEPPRLVLDAGTGLQRLSRSLGGRPFRGTVLVGHLHWDHTHGIPFFAAGDHPEAEVTLVMPEQGDARAVLARMMSPPHFPIRPEELRGRWRFAGLEEGEHEIEGWSVLAREIPHKGGRTFGYRVSGGGLSVAYLSDHSPLTFGPGPDGLGEYHRAAVDLVSGVDVLVHDAQHTAEELPARAAFGHSAAEYAVALGERCGVGRVVLFHHDPGRTDGELDGLVARFRDAALPVEAAREGAVIEVGTRVAVR